LESQLEKLQKVAMEEGYMDEMKVEEADLQVQLDQREIQEELLWKQKLRN